MTELVETPLLLPVVASFAMAMTVRGWHAGRRRSALNEALHELRRPLQSLVLAAGSGAPPRVLEGSAQLTSLALERLEREINGGALRPPAETFAARPLVESAVSRWRARASLGGGSLQLRWQAGEALVEADRFGLAQALDNLIVNAIEHGGPLVSVEARAGAGRLRVTVADSGRASRSPARSETPAELVARLSGRRRRGHGLAVVRRVAAAHGGRFALRCSERGSLAALELPLARAGTESAA